MCSVDYDPIIAVEKGLLGKTSWYNRHRTGNSDDRRIANKRRYVFPKNIMIGNQEIDDVTMMKNKKELKARLQKKFTSSE